MAGLLEVLKGKRQRAETVTARIEALRREQATAAATLRARREERDRLTRQVVDTRALALLEEDRQSHDAELQRLEAHLPEIDRELHDLQEVLPAIERHLAELEHKAKVVRVTEMRDGVIHAGEGREDLLRRWNRAAEAMLSAADAVGRFNGRNDAQVRGYQTAAREAKQAAEGFDHLGIPVVLLHALIEELRRTWQDGYAHGEAL